jgi:hypothetical protein
MGRLLRKSQAEHNKSVILQDILKANDISIDDVAYISCVDKSVVEKWFDGLEQPSDFALMQLKSALYVAHMTIPKSLIKFTHSQESRAKYWGNKFKTDADKPNVHRDNKQIEKYGFHGKQMILSEIQKDKRCVISVNTLRCRIRVQGLKCGEDISKIAGIHTQQGREITKTT